MKNMESIVMERLNCTENDAVILCNELEKIAPILVPLLDRWIEVNDESDATTYHGYSINSLRTDYGMNFIAALLTLDWIIKEPATAAAVLKEGIM